MPRPFFEPKFRLLSRVRTRTGEEGSVSGRVQGADYERYTVFFGPGDRRDINAAELELVSHPKERGR